MYVKYYMTPNPITIMSNATISTALSLMNDSGVHRIPVIKNDKMIGIISDGDIQKASPSKATSLSIYEINYLLSKSTVSDFMSKDVVSISPGALLEEAITMMKDYKVRCLPVIEHEKLVGIITETDLFKAFIDILGFNKIGSSRITIDIREDKLGVIAKLSSIMKAENISISNIVVYRENDPLQVVLRINTTDTDHICNVLKENDFKVTHVLKKEVS